MNNGQPDFIITKEHRRFVEFCNACWRYRYIGLCYGTPGIGKTLSARVYANWDLVSHSAAMITRGIPRVPELLECSTVFYTAPVAGTPRRIEKEVSQQCRDLSHLVEATQQLVEGKEDYMISFNPPEVTELLIVDEADRLKPSGLEQIRDIYDQRQTGLVLIGMPGLEKRLSRYSQLYSRVGFVHKFKPLSADEMRFILHYKWEQLGLRLDYSDFTDTEALAAIIRITGGNFRLLQRLLAQVERILEINELQTITKEVVETAREGLIIGVT
jgi:DNA transposition AAA+ family ATPase